MNYEAFFEECKRIFTINGAEVPSEDQAKKLYDLTEIMLRVNEKMNLTTIKDSSDIILKHYFDSLSVSKYIPEGAKVIDVGCGAGFPSLPLAVFRPDISITPLDSTAKRIDYVRETAEALGLSNVTPIAARAEDMARLDGHRESYDVAVARAVADLQILSELCLPFVALGGRFVAMKAAKGDEEFSRSARAIKILGGGDAKILSADITGDGENFEKRRLIIAEKVEKTPKIYPRNFSQISKKPL